MVPHSSNIATSGAADVVVAYDNSEASRAFENAGELLTARAHEFDIGLRRSVAVIEGALLLGLSPEYLVVAVRIERWIDVNEVDAVVGEFLELVQIIPAVDDAGVHERRGLAAGSAHQRNRTEVLRWREYLLMCGSRPLPAYFGRPLFSSDEAA